MSWYWRIYHKRNRSSETYSYNANHCLVHVHKISKRTLTKPKLKHWKWKTIHPNLSRKKERKWMSVSNCWVRATKVPNIYGIEMINANEKNIYLDKSNKENMMARIISLCHDYYSLRSRTPISPYHRFLFASLLVQIKFCVVYDDGFECCSFLRCDCYGCYGSKCYCCSRTDPFKITNCNCTKNRDYVKKKRRTHTYTNHQLS